jgi:hypothetical protein
VKVWAAGVAMYARVCVWPDAGVGGCGAVLRAGECAACSCGSHLCLSLTDFEMSLASSALRFRPNRSL